MVEMRRFELLTPCLQGRCSPSELHPHVAAVSCRASDVRHIKIGYADFLFLSVLRLPTSDFC